MWELLINSKYLKRSQIVLVYARLQLQKTTTIYLSHPKVKLSVIQGAHEQLQVSLKCFFTLCSRQQLHVTGATWFQGREEATGKDSWDAAGTVCALRAPGSSRVTETQKTSVKQREDGEMGLSTAIKLWSGNYRYCC